MQVGIRDLGRAERARMESDARIVGVFDLEWTKARRKGRLKNLVHACAEWASETDRERDSVEVPEVQERLAHARLGDVVGALERALPE